LQHEKFGDSTQEVSKIDRDNKLPVLKLEQKSEVKVKETNNKETDANKANLLKEARNAHKMYVIQHFKEFCIFFSGLPMFCSSNYHLTMSLFIYSVFPSIQSYSVQILLLGQKQKQ